MSTAFRSAATIFAELVRAIPESAWDGPGLGDWDLRALVGHASRSLITVSTYLRAPADREDVASPADYYVWVRDHLATADPGAIVERGRQAGRDLGADPAAAVEELLKRALDDVAAVEDPLITVIGGLGLRLSTYLPTRVFELAVHGLDIARAVGLDLTLPDDVVEEATVLAARISVRFGTASPALLALTGRSDLPPGFSVV
ncbi:mycothiol maleylpyruvate isomerase [Mycolicibacterium sp. P1-18]|uniref:maleylpyruvate isomerase N-terminal domain-containing protein n=1 Tax=Mycolicibacterium sp. P1-18 TaxID=2024615 RepID=UPI0011F0C95B|nr:maleylpyruvate isomerase N-terminal domain-containing protein [Mycolicibacterium sp. P1-18]KAA0096731.1 mycothiol maleylpyruvate isomerase [Mycolicibacterium sp. P1-18]